MLQNNSKQAKISAKLGKVRRLSGKAIQQVRCTSTFLEGSEMPSESEYCVECNTSTA